MSRFDIHRVARHLTHHPRWVMCTVQLAIFAVAGVLAFLLRFDFTVPAQYRPHLLAALCVFVPAKIFAFYFFKMDRGWWRYASIRDVARLAAANLPRSVLGCLALLCLPRSPGLPALHLFSGFLLCFGMTAGVRVAVRLAFEFSRLPNLTAGNVRSSTGPVTPEWPCSARSSRIPHCLTKSLASSTTPRRRSVTSFTG